MADRRPGRSTFPAHSVRPSPGIALREGLCPAPRRLRRPLAARRPVGRRRRGGGASSARAQMQKAGSSFREEPASARPFRLGRGSTHLSPGSSFAPGIGTAKALRLLPTHDAPRTARQIPKLARMNPALAARCGRGRHRGGGGEEIRFGEQAGHGDLVSVVARGVSRCLRPRPLVNLGGSLKEGDPRGGQRRCRSSRVVDV